MCRPRAGICRSQSNLDLFYFSLEHWLVWYSLRCCCSFSHWNILFYYTSHKVKQGVLFKAAAVRHDIAWPWILFFGSSSAQSHQSMCVCVFLLVLYLIWQLTTYTLQRRRQCLASLRKTIATALTRARPTHSMCAREHSIQTPADFTISCKKSVCVV